VVEILTEMGRGSATMVLWFSLSLSDARVDCRTVSLAADLTGKSSVLESSTSALQDQDQVSSTRLLKIQRDFQNQGG